MNVEILEMKGHHFLWIDDELWMWDVADEVHAQQRIAEQAVGDVLVIGYGLGLVQSCLVQNKKVLSVLTVEKDIQVTTACSEYFGELYGDVLLADFYKMEPKGQKFDCVIGDIWRDVAPEALDEYKRFKAHAEKFLYDDSEILAWGQDYFEYLIEKEKK